MRATPNQTNPFCRFTHTATPCPRLLHAFPTEMRRRIDVGPIARKSLTGGWRTSWFWSTLIFCEGRRRKKHPNSSRRRDFDLFSCVSCATTGT